LQITVAATKDNAAELRYDSQGMIEDLGAHVIAID
jgi:hypothetical protein